MAETYRINSTELQRVSSAELRIKGQDGSTMRIFIKDGRLEVDHDTRGACSTCGGGGWIDRRYDGGGLDACHSCNRPTYAKREPRW